MKTKKKYMTILISAAVMLLIALGCGGSDVVEDVDTDVNTIADVNVEDSENSELYEDTGSFSFDTTVGSAFADYEEDNVTDFIGLWYEDGNLDGYSLTISGNGSWVQHGENTLTGYLTTGACVAYMYTDDGTDVGMLTLYGDGTSLNLSCVDRDILDFHLDPTTLKKESASSHLGSMQDYYDTFFTYEFMMGDWYPDGDWDSDVHFTIYEDGLWQRYFNYKESVEYGNLTDDGDGYYSSTEINYGADYTFYYPGDGSLWINDTQYFRMEGTEDNYF